MTAEAAGRLRRVALTGGIATGKSYCLNRFRELGAPTIDADLLARDAVTPGSEALLAIAHRFGRHLVDEHGELDRAGLGRLVFGDRSARRDLEAIIHPLVYQTIARWFESLESASERRPAAAVADIPLLFETGREDQFDDVIVVTCRPDLQLSRLMARGGLTEAEARQRMDSQSPLAEKRAQADYLIDTSGSLDETDRQVRDVWAALTR